MSARAYTETLSGVVGAPIVALLNQELTYSVNMWACGHDVRGVMHIVPAVCLFIALAFTIVSYRAWGMVGRGVEDEAAPLESRVRFLAILGTAIGAFSSAVVLAQWAAVVVFQPCARA